MASHFQRNFLPLLFRGCRQSSRSQVIFVSRLNQISSCQSTSSSAVTIFNANEIAERSNDKLQNGDLRAVFEAEKAAELEKNAKMLEANKRLKIAQIKALHAHIVQQRSEEMRAEYDQMLANFECQLAMFEGHSPMEQDIRNGETEIGETKSDHLKRAHLRALFRFLNALYRDLTKSGFNEKRAIEQISAAIDSVPPPPITALKRRCLIGAILLTTNRSISYLDYLKMQKKNAIDGIELNFLCRLAITAKEPRILENVLQVPPVFLPTSSVNIAKIYTTLALIYGLKSRKTRNRVDEEAIRQLDALWEHLERRLHKKRNHDEFKHVLHRIAHFYKCANRKAPPSLVRQIHYLDRQPYSFKLTREEWEERNESQS